MNLVTSIAALIAAASLWFAAATQADAQPTTIERVAVDASQAAQQIYHVRVTMPAPAGPFTFVYPKWIPGYHGPVGPIEGVVSLRVSANGARLDWRRDLVDMYAVHTIVPAGALDVDVDFDIVGAQSRNGQNAPISTSQLAVIEYSNFVVYPQGATAYGTQVQARLTLPAGWTFGTALPIAATTGASVTFKPAMLYTVIDSPIIAGAHEKAFALGGNQELDVAADSAPALELTPKFLAAMRHLVAEAPALYGGKHYRDYHFLLSLSDAIESNGIEHHESSDNRAGEKYASDDSNYSVSADLLPHEYSHSWNGKYRRPGDLFAPDYQAPEKTDLLWVYEGLNQYNGEKLATRAGLNSFATQLDELAQAAASMDVESGRQWRPVRDTADAAPILYVAPPAYYSIRRSAGDFYVEDDLIWLEADVTIRRLTRGAKSLDDFCRLWGNGSDTTNAPRVNPYDQSTVVELLNAVAPFDWSGFFTKRIATIAPSAPLGGITGGGYKLVYTEMPSALEKGQGALNKGAIDARFSIGLVLASDGAISDILTQSAAFRAGLSPGQKVVAIDGRRFTADALHDALRAHKGNTTPLQLIVSNGDFLRTVAFDASQGERHPHLVRVGGTEDVLAKIYAPKTFSPPQVPKGHR